MVRGYVEAEVDALFYQRDRYVQQHDDDDDDGGYRRRERAVLEARIAEKALFLFGGQFALRGAVEVTFHVRTPFTTTCVFPLPSR